MLIELKNVSHIYDDGQSTEALKNINLKISDHEFIGLVGHTGSGKSTLVQLLNGLIKPSMGTVTIDGLNITEGKTSLLGVRRKIGLVFQYPEHQLFEETIYGDVAFGPRNLQLDEEEVELRVREALELVGLDYEEFKDRSPFNLSGGQQRKVAIAGVLAMKPEVLILDEPSAGLDPQGRQQLINLLEYLYQKKGMTIILVSHRMEEIARLANRVIVMSEGEIILDDSPAKVFSEVEKIRQLGLDLPEITEILWLLNRKGLNVRTDLFSLPEAVEEISRELRGSELC